jgi:ABC-type sugar transport system substrate-binding protein
VLHGSKNWPGPSGVSWAILMVALALVLASCGGDDGAEAAKDGEPSSPRVDGIPSLEGKRVAYIKAGSVEFYEYSSEGSRLAVERLGGELVVFDSQFNPQTELKNVQDAIAQRVDGILLSSISKDSLVTAARLAEQAGIPVVDFFGYTSGVTDPDLVDAFIQADPTTWGNMMGGAMAEALEGCKGCEVAQVIGLLGRGEVEAATAAFTATAEGAGLKVVATPTSEWDRQQAFARTQELLQKYPDLRGIHVGDEDTAAGAIQALKQAGKKPGEIVVTSVYGSPEGVELMEAGWLQATANFSPPQQGAMATRLLSQVIAGENLAVPVPCLSPLLTITADNLSELQPWKPTPQLVSEWIREPCANQT